MSGGVRGRAAIVGMACRFPAGADTPQELWKLLDAGIDAIAPLPAGRFDAERFLDPEPGKPGKIVSIDGGFLAGIDLFDAPFFGLSPREAKKIDPQHRLLLEVVWEALEDAGIPPSSLAGKQVGVYVGLWAGEYENVMYRDPESLDFHSITGGGRYSASGRLSFALDLRGPAMTVDTGCSSGLVALDAARQALELGEIDLAVVGAANLVLQPHVNIGYSRSGMLSAGARCRFGDAGASGYVRSDGVAAVILKPAEQVDARRDPLHAVLRSSAVNADGRGSGQLATPSTDAQAELLRSAYARAGVDPATVRYVEAHGTGTRAGDPAELGALGSVLGAAAGRTQPLLVGSVKTAIGHTEACAGLAGLIKTVLVLRQRRVPRNLHHDEPNPDIDFEGLGIAIPTRPSAWPAGDALLAGVSSFGITGTNAHAVIEGIDEPAAEAREDGDEAAVSSPMLLTLSGHSEAALVAAAGALRERISAPDAPCLGDLAYTLNVRRDHHLQRAAMLATSVDELREVLGEVDGEHTGAALIRGTASGVTPRVAFVFSGQGSQWLGMGRELMEHASGFASSIGESDAILARRTGWSLRDVLAGDSPMDTIDVIQPALVAVQIALARQLEAWGIAPHAVVGHSMGEVAAAHVCGALTLDEALDVIVTRSRLLARIAGKGAMALVDETVDSVAAHLERHDGKVSIAAVNGPRTTVVSGDPEAVDAVLEELEQADVFCRRVRVDVASHSAQTEPLLADLGKELASLNPRATEVGFYSTPLGKEVGGDSLDASYWQQNLRRPVLLLDAVGAMIDDGIDTFVEISPHPILLASLADIAAAAADSVTSVALLRREEPEAPRLLEAVGRLHTHGVAVDWEALADPDARCVPLPHYPFQRESLWLDNWEDWSDGGGSTAARVRWPEGAGELLYGFDWEEAEAHPDEVLGADVGRWLIVGPRGALTNGLAAQCAARGRRAECVVWDDESHAREEIENAFGALDGSLTGIVVVADSAAPGVGPDRAACSAAETVTAVLQHIGSDEPGSTPRLVIATTGAQPAAESMVSEAGLSGGALWGFSRVVRDEYPDLDLLVVDVDPGAGADETVLSLLKECWRDSGDAEIAIRGGRRYRRRIERREPPAEVAERRAWPRHGATLISGGLGDLGLVVASHLASQGVRRLILLSRTPLPERARWAETPPDTAAGRKIAAIRALEAEGASVHCPALDVGDADQLERFLAAYRAEGWPEINAVVHLAGVLDSRLVRSLTPESLRAVFHGKAGGAWNLHRAFPEVERFMLFSSTAVVIPQAGEANYAAANAFLDALCHFRRARERECQVVNWGVWEGSGMLAERDRYVDEVKRQGVGSMSPETAVQVFDRIAASGTAQMIVAPVDWGRFAESRGGRHLGGLFERVAAEGSGNRPARGLEELRQLDPPARPEAVGRMIRDMIGTVLGVPADSIRDGVTFGAQGLDSLMAMELRNHIEGAFDLQVSATLAWNYPTVEKLTPHLLARIDLSDAASAAAAGETPPQGDGDSSAVTAPVDLGKDPEEPGAGTGLQNHLDEIADLSEEAVLRELRGGA